MTGIVLVLALLGASAALGQHSHAGTVESPLACAVCATAHHAPIPSPAVAPLLTPAPLLWLPSPIEPAGELPPVHPLVYRSRAPPSA